MEQQNNGVSKKKIRKKNLVTIGEEEKKLEEKLKLLREKKQQHISSLFSKIFSDFVSETHLLEILDENKDNKEFIKNLSKVLKEEIVKTKE
ncbi:MAG: hypothetical protein ACRDB9_08500 [Cetobacterium sp.]